jgi:hypothetical protein
MLTSLKNMASSAGIAIPGLSSDRSYSASGQLSKMKLTFHKDASGGASASVGPKGESEIEFFLNPSAVTMTKELGFEESTDSTPEKQQVRAKETKPLVLNLGDLWFDTFDNRKNVRTEYIDTLEALLDPLAETHQPPVVAPCWGEFISPSSSSTEYYFYIAKLDVNYSMFLPDGTPVRAKVTIELKQVNPKDNRTEFQSPDHAKLYTVKRGDTLQSISNSEYDDPHEWRRIADLNGLSDPLNLKPGTKLLVPPILR